MPLVPAVAVGDRAVHGWNPEAYARLLGVGYRRPPRLEPAELARRLDRILEAATALVGVLPDPALGFTPPERERRLGDLAYHLFRVAASFPDALEQGVLPEAWFQEAAPAALGRVEPLAAWGASVRERLRNWLAAAPPATYERVVAVYYGPQDAHELLERTTWHAAQHLRQLYDLVDRLGIEPPRPLPADALAGLPLPEAVW
ncbi:MAG TPA: DinB family protein [Candidatus Binatia bacterium]|nr:DinB family protein [Candidatus Binatia bacterium]